MADRANGTRALSNYDPGADAAHRHSDWVIRHRDLRGVPEVMCPGRKVILLDDSRDRASRRCNLAHAIAHIDLDHQALAAGVLSKRQELAADKLAARRLVGIHALADAAAWAESFEELAAELEVDERMLWVRSRYMHPSERALVVRHLDRKLASA